MIAYILSALVTVFGLFVALWWRQPLGFLLALVGAVMLIYFFLSSDASKNK